MKASLILPAVASALLLASSAVLASGNAAGSGTELLVDCSSRALPSQKAVGEMLGEANFGLVYAARSRLMVEASRACNRPGTSQVRLVLVPADRGTPARRKPALTVRVALAGK